MSLGVDNLVSLLVQCQQKLYAYILTLVGDMNIADDVLQETNVVLWKKRDEYDPSMPLLNWAMRIAHYQVMAHRTYEHRNRLRFNEALIEKFAVESVEAINGLDRRREAMSDCLDQLSSPDRELIHYRYDQALSAGEIAERVHRSVGAIYQAMRRIRLGLAQCIRQRLQSEGDE